MLTKYCSATHNCPHLRCICVSGSDAIDAILKRTAILHHTIIINDGLFNSSDITSSQVAYYWG